MRALIFLPILFTLAACDRENAKATGEPSLNKDQELSFSDASTPAPVGYKLPDGKLTQRDLIGWAKIVRDYSKPDQFSKDFDSGVANGREFSATIPILEFSGKSENVYWEYDANKELISIQIWPRQYKSPAIRILYSESDLGSAVMSNAFGASRDVKKSEKWTIGIGRNDVNPLGVFHPGEYSGVGTVYYDELMLKIPIKPEEARSFVQSLAVQFEGRIKKGEEGQTVICEMEFVQPTIQNPNESKEHVCSIGAHFDRIAIFSGTKLIKEWTDKSTKNVSARITGQKNKDDQQEKLDTPEPSLPDEDEANNY